MPSEIRHEKKMIKEASVDVVLKSSLTKQNQYWVYLLMGPQEEKGYELSYSWTCSTYQSMNSRLNLDSFFLTIKGSTMHKENGLSHNKV